MKIKLLMFLLQDERIIDIKQRTNVSYQSEVRVGKIMMTILLDDTDKNHQDLLVKIKIIPPEVFIKVPGGDIKSFLITSRASLHLMNEYIDLFPNTYSAHESLMLSHCLKHFPFVKWGVATLETPVLRRSKEN